MSLRTQRNDESLFPQSLVQEGRSKEAEGRREESLYSKVFNLGVSKSGKSVTFEGITVFEVNDAEQIQTTRAYWNPEAMIAQLRS